MRERGGSHQYSARHMRHSSYVRLTPTQDELSHEFRDYNP